MSKSVGTCVRRLEAARGKVKKLVGELTSLRDALFSRTTAIDASPLTSEFKRKEVAQLRNDTIGAAKELAATVRGDLAEARNAAAFLTRDAWVRNAKFVEPHQAERGIDVGAKTPAFVDGKAAVRREEKLLEFNSVIADEMVRTRFRADLRELPADEIEAIVDDPNTPVAALGLARRILSTRRDIGNKELTDLRVRVDKRIHSAELPKDYQRGQRLASEVVELGTLVDATVAEIEAGEERAQTKALRLRRIREANPNASTEEVIDLYMKDVEAARAKRTEATKVQSARIVSETLSSISQVANGGVAG